LIRVFADHDRFPQAIESNQLVNAMELFSGRPATTIAAWGIASCRRGASIADVSDPSLSDSDSSEQGAAAAARRYEIHPR
jgi:hypothetical protein